MVEANIEKLEASTEDVMWCGTLKTYNKGPSSPPHCARARWHTPRPGVSRRATNTRTQRGHLSPATTTMPLTVVEAIPLLASEWPPPPRQEPRAAHARVAWTGRCALDRADPSPGCRVRPRQHAQRQEAGAEQGHLPHRHHHRRPGHPRAGLSSPTALVCEGALPAGRCHFALSLPSVRAHTAQHSARALYVDTDRALCR